MKKTVEVVGAVSINEQGEILCTLRSPQMSLPNVWEFPGGKMEGAPTAKEHAEFKWIALEDLSSLHWAPADISTVEALLAEKVKV